MNIDPAMRALIKAMFDRRGSRGKNAHWLAEFTPEQQAILLDVLGQDRFPP